MSAKQSRIEKLKLEVRKLEAERDGLKQVREGTDTLESDSMYVFTLLWLVRLDRVTACCLSAMMPLARNRWLPYQSTVPRKAGLAVLGWSSDKTESSPLERSTDVHDSLFPTRNGVLVSLQHHASWSETYVSEAKPASRSVPATFYRPSASSISKTTIIYKYAYMWVLTFLAQSRIPHLVPTKAAESQAGLFKDGYAELKAYLEEMKTHRSPPPSSSDMTPTAEVARRLGQEKPPPKARQHPRRHLSGLASVSDDVSQPAVEGRAGTARDRLVDKPDGGGYRGPTLKTRASKGSSRHFVAHAGDCTRDEGDDDDDDDSSCCTPSEGSGTLWVRVMPTDEYSSDSSEEELPRSPESISTHWRGREELLRRYLSGGDGGESETPSRSQNRTWAAKAQPKRSIQTDQADSSRAASEVDAAGAASGNGRSSSPDRRGDEEHTSDGFGPETRLHKGSDNKRPGMQRENRHRRMLDTELAATADSVSGSGVFDRSRAGSRPGLLDSTEGEGPERSWVKDS